MEQRTAVSQEQRCVRAQRITPGEAPAVGPGVVDQDPFDAVDAHGLEERGGPVEEGRAGGCFLIAVDLAVGQAAVVVDGGVDVVEAHAAAPGPASPAAQGLVTAARGDPAGNAHLPGCDHLSDSEISAPKFGWVASPDSDSHTWSRISESEPLRATQGNTDRVATRRCQTCDARP
ncbi:hypothetical protein Srufu_013420 [Streptomyces libani subsp. rufus]|nr:hypothetical protein Srufu_013420 [Streptomyces libani subsp. rufus]